MMSLSWLIVLFLLNALTGKSCARKISVDTAGGLIDSEGRSRFFHGVNFVEKGTPWYPASLLDDRRLELFRQWGFNFVRLGCMWSGVFPQAGGRPNLTYLAVMDDIVQRAERHGLHVLLDMHQDVMSSRFRGYDGVPRWLVDQFPRVQDPRLQFPWPFKPDQPIAWSTNYFTLEASQAFQSLYDNKADAWSHWADFWTTVAGRFGWRSNVIGYELINEPWAGDIYSNSLRLLPGYAGRYNLLPVYDYLVNAIRQVDTETMVFFEPVTWGYFLPGDEFQGTGFDRVPGGEQWRNVSVMSYHYYCWLLNSDPSQDYPLWKQAACDEFLSNQLFQSVVKDQKKYKYGIFLTEFGICKPDNNSHSVNTIECSRVLNDVDDFLQSWAYWDSEFFQADNVDRPIWSVVRQFARTYPQAVAGKISKIYFDYKTALFGMTFELDTSIAAPTLIVVPLSVHHDNDVSKVHVRVVSRGLPVQHRVEWDQNILQLTITQVLAQNTAIDVWINKIA